VFEIVACLPLTQPTISHHLRILREAGLIDYQNKGRWAYYYLRRAGFSQAQIIIENLMRSSIESIIGNREKEE